MGGFSIMSVPSIFYLHGFASSPQSSKAQYLNEHLQTMGLELRAPDLNVPSFRELTLTAMIGRVGEEIRQCPEGPVYLIGSSMGAMVALHTADRLGEPLRSRIRKMMFLAPGFDFVRNREVTLGREGIEEWKRTGARKYFHYGYGEEREVGYQLMEDMAGYDSFSVEIRTPILLFHGRNDETVNYRQSERFAERSPLIDLRLVDSDHSLYDHIEMIWAAMVEFFELGVQM